MKKKVYWKRGIALGLVAATALGLCACGGKKSGKSDAEHYFKANYLDNAPASYSNSISCNIIKGDTLYYCGNDEDYTKSGIYSYDLVQQKETTYWESDPFYDEDQTYLGSTNFNSMAVDKDGNIYVFVNTSTINEESANKDYSNATQDDVIQFFVDQWGYAENEAVDEWNNYWVSDYTADDGTINYAGFLKNMALTYDNTNAFWKIAPDGTMVWQHEVTIDENENYSCSGLVADDSGNLIALENRWDNDGTQDKYYVTVYDGEGNSKNSIELSDYAYGLKQLPDGTVGVISYGDSALQLTKVDLEKGTLGDAITIPAENFIPYKDNTILVNNGTQLQEYNLDNQESKNYLSWLTYNISGSSVVAFGFLSNDEIAVVTNTYDSSTGTSSCAIILLTEVDKSEVTQVTELHIACMYADSDMEQKIIAFNKAHTDYRIVLQQYSDDNTDWDTMVNNFTTALMSDTDIDMVVFSDFSQVTSLAAKGLLADMYEEIDADSEINREDFLQNILKSCEVNGKLVALPTGFTLQTVVAKASDVGTKPGWTIEAAQNLLAGKPEGTQLFYGMERETALRNLVNLNYANFVDVESGKCNFNNADFVAALEYANMFPETFDWSDDVDTAELLHDGKVLCSEYYLSDFSEIQLQRVVMNDDITFIGYPTASGNGALLSFNSIYGITKNCENKDIAWEFLRQFYENQDRNSNYYYWGFSVRQDAFDKYCADAMKEDNDSAGSSYGWGNYTVEIQPATQEEVDQVKELVEGTTAVSGSVSNDVFNIINEEAQFYFSGEQSAESVAQKVQSRMEIYLSETK